MEPAKKPMTGGFGMEVTIFCAKHGMTIKQLAEQTAIPYNTLRKVMKGVRAGHKAIPIVKAYMHEFKKR